MKKILTLAAVPAALIGLSACSTYDGGYGYASYGYSGYGNSGYSDYGYSPGYSGGIWYDAYYDDFYGPVHGGYWAPDGYFWYQTRIGGSYVRDHARHFRRDHHNGFKAYRYQDNRGGNRGNWDRDRNDRNTYPPLFSGQRNDRDRDRDRGNNQNWNGGRDNNPRGNPAPGGGQWNGNRDRDRDGDRGRNNGGNANGGRGGGSPPLFSGQQPPRANPAAPQLDGAPRGGRGGDDRPRSDNDRGRGGDSPSLFRGQRDQKATPAPAPQQRQAQPRQQRSDGDRGDRSGVNNRFNGQGRNGGGDNKERGRGRNR